MVTVTVAVKLSPNKEKEFVQAMDGLAEEGKEVSGLKVMKWYGDKEDESHFDVVLEWEKAEDVRNYLEMEHFKIFRGALNVLCEKSAFMCDSPIWLTDPRKEAKSEKEDISIRLREALQFSM